MADLHRRRPVGRRATEIRKAVLRRAAARPLTVLRFSGASAPSRVRAFASSTVR